ncbi:MAG: OsmC family protein [Candidatus Polarisedimenticolia bacterium]
MPVRQAKAQWEGDLKDGRGNMKLGSGAWEGPFSFTSRMENGSGTNPEELIGAAHAGCYSMALSSTLTKAGHKPRRIQTSAQVHFDKVGDGFGITRIQLTTEGSVPGINEQDFMRLAEEAKNTCVVSRALKGVPIELQASLTK